jgi:hypothetical protein
VGTKFERVRVFAHSVGDAIRRVASIRAYHPERHYMRGPGPKTMAKLGEQLRVRTDGIIREPLPEEWMTLLRKLDRQDRRRLDLVDAGHHARR